MAKVDEIKISINGTDYKYNINVRKDGIFRCVLDMNVATLLGLDGKEISSGKLSDVTSIIYNALNKYELSDSKYEMFIILRYKAMGVFMKDSNGEYMFGYNDSKHLHIAFSSELSALAFGYEVLIKKSSSISKATWYSTTNLKNEDSEYAAHVKSKEKEHHPNFECTKYELDSGYFMSISEEEMLIPYSEEAVATLDGTLESVRLISEGLHNFIDQEPDVIKKSLTSGKLLNN